MANPIYTEKDVRAKYGRGLPKFRKIRRSKDFKRMFDKTDRAEMAAVIDWLVHDYEFRDLVDTYACYCRILVRRGYGSQDDRWGVLANHEDMLQALMRNFAKCEVEYIWHDLLAGPAEILGDGGGDGYWPFLDKAYLDITNMRVGTAIVNLDEVWAVVRGTLDEFIQKCASREAQAVSDTHYTCDRCGAKIYAPDKSRFDRYENLLHCEKCAKECTHWKGHRK